MKILILRRKWLTAACCLTLSAVMLWVVGHPDAVGAAATQRQLPIYCVETASDEKLAAISFDAAWGNEDTQELIDILASYDVPATFFVVAEWVEKYPESVRALSEAGHDVMNHSTTHPYMTQCSVGEMVNEIQTCNEKIEAITGVRPTLFRCPYGDYDDTVISTVRSLEMEPIQWNVDSLDWKGITAEEITQNVLNKVTSGSIVLFHNAADHTPEALPGIISSLQNDGYTLVKIADLIGDGDYTIDSAGMQHPAE